MVNSMGRYFRVLREYVSTFYFSNYCLVMVAATLFSIVAKGNPEDVYIPETVMNITHGEYGCPAAVPGPNIDNTAAFQCAFKLLGASASEVASIPALYNGVMIPGPTPGPGKTVPPAPPSVAGHYPSALYIPSGIYLISSTIFSFFTHSFHVFGDGSNKTIIQWSAPTVATSANRSQTEIGSGTQVGLITKNNPTGAYRVTMNVANPSASNGMDPPMFHFEGAHHSVFERIGLNGCRPPSTSKVYSGVPLVSTTVPCTAVAGVGVLATDFGNTSSGLMFEDMSFANFSQVGFAGDTGGPMTAQDIQNGYEYPNGSCKAKDSSGKICTLKYVPSIAMVSEVTFRRTQFLNIGYSAIVTGGSNALDYWIYDNSFTGCGRAFSNYLNSPALGWLILMPNPPNANALPAVTTNTGDQYYQVPDTQGSGSAVYFQDNQFNLSSFADFEIQNTGYFGFIRNQSLGSNAFMVSHQTGTNGAQFYLQSNVVLTQPIVGNFPFEPGNQAAIQMGAFAALVMLENSIGACPASSGAGFGVSSCSNHGGSSVGDTGIMAYPPAVQFHAPHEDELLSLPPNAPAWLEQSGIDSARYSLFPSVVSIDDQFNVMVPFSSSVRDAASATVSYIPNPLSLIETETFDTNLTQSTPTLFCSDATTTPGWAAYRSPCEVPPVGSSGKNSGGSSGGNTFMSRIPSRFTILASGDRVSNPLNPTANFPFKAAVVIPPQRSYGRSNQVISLSAATSSCLEVDHKKGGWGLSSVLSNPPQACSPSNPPNAVTGVSSLSEFTQCVSQNDEVNACLNFTNLTSSSVAPSPPLSNSQSAWISLSTTQSKDKQGKTISTINWDNVAKLCVRAMVDYPCQNSVNLQNAVSAAAASKPDLQAASLTDWAVIKFPDSPFPISSTINIPAMRPILFLGSSRQSIVEWADAAPIAATAMFRVGYPASVAFQDLTIAGPGSGLVVPELQENSMVGIEVDMSGRPVGRVYSENLMISSGSAGFQVDEIAGVNYENQSMMPDTIHIGGVPLPNLNSATGKGSFAIFGGSLGPNQNPAGANSQIQSGAEVLLQNVWHDGTNSLQRVLQLSGPSTFQMIAGNMAGQPGPWPVGPEISLTSTEGVFSGQASFVNVEFWGTATAPDIGPVAADHRTGRAPYEINLIGNGRTVYSNPQVVTQEQANSLALAIPSEFLDMSLDGLLLSSEIYGKDPLQVGVHSYGNQLSPIYYGTDACAGGSCVSSCMRGSLIGLPFTPIWGKTDSNAISVNYLKNAFSLPLTPASATPNAGPFQPRLAPYTTDVSHVYGGSAIDLGLRRMWINGFGRGVWMRNGS